MTLKVGLTGNIGSGKSTISKIFSALNIPIFYADDEAKLVLNSPVIYDKLISVFGEQISLKKDSIDKTKLASIVFNDPNSLQILNNIIHPEVHKRFIKWLEAYKSSKYVIMEAAILFESSFDKYVDLSINVHADKSIRSERVVKRDNIDINSVLARMQNQLSDEKKIKLADYTIDNNGNKMVLPQVLKIHEYLKNKRGSN